MFQLFSCGQKRFPATYGSPFQANIPFHPATAEQQQRIGQWQWQKSDFSVLGPFMGAASMFPPLIDMSTTQTLLAMVRTAKEAELQGLLKNVKRPDSSSPLDLSAAAPPPTKRLRIKTPTLNSPSNVQSGNVGPVVAKRSPSQSPRLHHAEDITSWTVDDVCNFVSTIDICAEYAQVSGSVLIHFFSQQLSKFLNYVEIV